MYTISTKYFSYTFSPDGKNISFTDRETGVNHIVKNTYCAYLTDHNKKIHYPVSAEYSDGIMKVRFDNAVCIETEVKLYEKFVTFTLISASSEDFHAVAFVNIEVDMDYSSYSLDTGSGGFTASLMGLTVSTRMAEYPGRNTRLVAEGYPKIGLFSTRKSKYPVKCAVIAMQDSEMRTAMKSVMEIIPDGELPKSKCGGAYAYDVKDARRTYTNLLDIRDGENTVRALKAFGITEIGVHQGIPYRQGDFAVNEALYPGGVEEFKRKIKFYQDNGIRVNLHTYTFFVDHSSSYLTPVPHKDLDHICELKLAKPLGREDTTVYVNTLEGVQPVYGYSVVSSKYIQIGNELLRFGGVDEENCAFTDCERGAQGTAVSAHSVGEDAYQLKEYFCFVAPKAGSDLFYEVARRTAEFFNECNFDGFYLDAIDGVFALEGNDYAWYHAMDFINEMFKYLKRTPVFGCCYNPQYTASWYVRSRYGALDSACRAHRDYIDAHVGYNDRTADRMYLPPDLGWFDIYSDPKAFQYGWQAKLMSAEDVEYLCSKIVGTDASMCYRRFSVYNHDQIPLLARFSEIVRKYGRARADGQLTPKLRHKLRQPGAEFSLTEKDGKFSFREAQTKRKKLEDICGGYNSMIFDNAFDEQAPMIRIEPLYSAGNYGEDGILLHEFDENSAIPNDVTYELPRIDSEGKNGIGIWVYGDGSGVSMRIWIHNRFVGAPTKNSEFHVKCDFTGWRYFAFYESQNGDASREDWNRIEMVYKEFTDVEKFYAYYRDGVDYSSIDYLRITLNTDKPTGIRLRGIKLLPYRETVLNHPTLSINGRKITFQCKLRPKTRLELSPDGRCEITDYKGHVLQMPEYTGDIPRLICGENVIRLETNETAPYIQRAELTLRAIGRIVN